MKLLGFAPDLDPTLEGVLTDCDAVVPSMKGLRGAPSAQNTLLPAMSSTCLGAASVIKLDDSIRTFVGEATKLKEASTATYVEVTRTAAGSPSPYTTVTGRWRFAQFGNATIAASKENTTQSSVTGVFADISGSPKGDIVETVNQFVLLFNTNDGTYGDSPNRWWCCALSDYTNWTPSIATQAATGLLVSVPGKITAGRRFGDDIIVYKQRGMYRGVYTGPPFIWSFTEIPSNTGAWCQEAVVNIGTPEQPKHFFCGLDNFYIYDGARPTPVGFDLKSYFFSRLNAKYAHLICCAHDQTNSRVYVFYPSGSSQSLTDCVVWNYRTGRWGKDTRSIEYATDFISGGITYDDIGSYYSTYGDLPNLPYDAGFLVSSSSNPAIFNTSHKMQVLSGVTGDAYITTGDVGDNNMEVLVSRVKPKWFTKPTTASLVNYYRQDLGDSLSSDSGVDMSRSRFDLLRSARWHRFKVNMSGDFEFNQMDVMVQEDGSE